MAASPLGHRREEGRAFVFGQPQGIGEGPHGVGLRALPGAALERAHGVGREARPRGQLFLAKPGGPPHASQALAEGDGSSSCCLVCRIGLSHWPPGYQRGSRPSRISGRAPLPSYDAHTKGAVWVLCEFCAWPAASRGGRLRSVEQTEAKEDEMFTGLDVSWCASTTRTAAGVERHRLGERPRVKSRTPS
jgi:hypothetical protein